MSYFATLPQSANEPIQQKPAHKIGWFLRANLYGLWAFFNIAIVIVSFNFPYSDFIGDWKISKYIGNGNLSHLFFNALGLFLGIVMPVLTALFFARTEVFKKGEVVASRLMSYFKVICVFIGLYLVYAYVIALYFVGCGVVGVCHEWGGIVFSIMILPMAAGVELIIVLLNAEPSRSMVMDEGKIEIGRSSRTKTILKWNTLAATILIGLAVFDYQTQGKYINMSVKENYSVIAEEAILKNDGNVCRYSNDIESCLARFINHKYISEKGGIGFGRKGYEMRIKSLCGTISENYKEKCFDAAALVINYWIKSSILKSDLYRFRDPAIYFVDARIISATGLAVGWDNDIGVTSVYRNIYDPVPSNDYLRLEGHVVMSDNKDYEEVKKDAQGILENTISEMKHANVGMDEYNISVIVKASSSSRYSDRNKYLYDVVINVDLEDLLDTNVDSFINTLRYYLTSAIPASYGNGNKK